MGVPKFYRYISERYPSLSEVVKEYQIPDFDHLYLDMNGIIHMCSHPDDENPLFRITEEKIFQNIFHYIELLFRMIQPRKLFFMAVDGVAPRAKMNQQRGRRFRTAKDAEVREAKAIAKGEKIPSEARFDSNCITPGTVFMVHLHEQLKYFISNKISTDKLWKRCRIVLSGHETPGEGEHKIMDYIRYMKSQPNYDPNTKHCLYGLDADLIMLGLCTHEPHFCLLREEVKFGRKARSSIPEETTFHLLHLSLMREYLELEFIELKDKISFHFNIEKIIDDWVLMGFLVGNDFIPHLPNMHISNGSLAILYKVYIEVLPQLSGYINEAGKLNLKHFEKYMEALSKVDLDKFQETYEDLKYFESKTGRKVNEKERICYKQKISQEFKPQDLTDEPDTTNIREVKTPMDSQLADLIRSTENEFMDYLEDENSSPDDSDNENDSNLFEAEFKQYKTDYYMNKLDYEKVTSEVLQSQAECYVRAIQWNLHYYYNGVCSWSWFYPHHYAPYISDIKGFANLELKFDIGKPFLPFQQLLAVLPAASKTLLPKPYQHLMTFKESPIINYYPSDFQTDLNGKRQEWEAVVLLPFIVESKLLEAMKSCESELTEEEIKRNSHGPMLVYEYTDESLGQYPAPNYFPDVKNNHARVTLVTAEDIHVPEDKLVKGVCPGIKTDIYFPGFPTLKHLEFSSVLKKAKVRVFDSPSRGDNLILILKELEEEPSIENLAEKLLGKIILVGWPHLTEAKVISVSNNLFKYSKGIPSIEQKYNIEENKGHLFSAWNSSRKAISEHYMNRLGVDIGNTKILVYALPMTGRKYIYEPSGKIILEKQWAPESSSFAFQTIVENLTVFDSYFATHKNIEDVFPIGCDCFILGPPYYGSKGVVIDNSITKNNGRIEVSVSVLPEPDFSKAKSIEEHVRVNYMSKFIASQRLGITPLLLSRITGTLFVISGIRMEPVFENASKTNIGLNMKFNKHGEEIPGYTKKSNDSTWLYSLKAIKLVEDYMNFCPELFHALSGKEKDENFFEAELFPNETETGETLKKIVNWIKAQPYNSVQRKLCSSKLLEPDVITEIEKAVNLSLSVNNGKNVTMQVKPQILYKSEIGLRSLPPDPKADYRMYDRIVTVRESHTVPFASKGTIIALHENNSSNEIKRNNDKMDWSYDVLFDHPFAGGLPLNCPDNRGYKMCATEMINLSYGARVAGNREIKPIQQSNNRQNRGFQAQFPNPQSPHSAFAIWNQQNKIENFSQPLTINNQYTPKNPDFLSKNQYKNVDQINPVSLAQNSFTNPNTSQSITALENINKYTPQLSEGSHLFMNQNAMCSAHELQAMWEKLNQIQINKSHTNINSNTSNSDISQNISENTEVLHNENNTQDSKIKYKPRISSETALQNLFPSFHNDRTKLNEELKMPESGPSQIVNISHNEKNSLNSTEVLKMMLQISDDKTSTPEETNRTSVSAHLTLPENSQKIPIQNFFQERKDVDNTSFYNQDSFCIKLLNMYQLYGLGIPRYNYLNSDDELIRAHVTLPDGRSIIGVPSTSREKASESAARIVLEEMKGRPILTVQQLPYLPSPPRQWYQKQNCNQSPRHNQNYPHPNPGTPNNYTKYDINIKQNENEKKYIHSAMQQIQGKSPFVPLQAVKQQRSKTTSNSSFVNKSKSEKSNLEEPSKKVQTLPINKKNSVDTPMEKSIVTTKTNNSSKPLKKIKKSRIAANFSMAKKE